MQAFLNIIGENITFIVFTMAVMLIVLAVTCIVTLFQLLKLKKKYDFFMGNNSKPNGKLETKLNEYIGDVKVLKAKYSRILKLTEDIDKNLECCVQKVGIVRYNPFDEVGGNLCFSVALLDSNDDGVVITGIHSRTGSFTYAKPVELSVSPYVLSEEEMEAITKAKNSQYVGVDRDIAIEKIKERKFHVKVRPKRKKYIRDEMIENQEDKEIKGQVALDEIMKEETEMESQIALDEVSTSESTTEKTIENNMEVENFEEATAQENDEEKLSTDVDSEIVDNSDTQGQVSESLKTL